VQRNEFAKGRDAFLAAVDNDASCVEAVFNLGLTYRRMGLNEKAMECFMKLHSVLRHQPEVVCQIANIHEEMGSIDLSIEWYLQVHTAVPSDGGILQKLGELFDRLGDRQQAFQYFSDVRDNLIASPFDAFH
jgi:intraflagellar transport protein 88